MTSICFERTYTSERVAMSGYPRIMMRNANYTPFVRGLGVRQKDVTNTPQPVTMIQGSRLEQ